MVGSMVPPASRNARSSSSGPAPTFAPPRHPRSGIRGRRRRHSPRQWVLGADFAYCRGRGSAAGTSLDPRRRVLTGVRAPLPHRRRRKAPWPSARLQWQRGRGSSGTQVDEWIGGEGYDTWGPLVSDVETGYQYGYFGPYKHTMVCT